MNIILIGMNHRTAPVEIRERLSIDCDDHNSSLTRIMEIPQIREGMFLSTCNRVEVLANVEDIYSATENLKSVIFPLGNLSSEELGKCLYIHHGDEAVRHVFRVTSSIDSMVIGEPQILGQVKDAYRRCTEHNSSGVILNRLLHHAFMVAKRVRTETDIADNAVSVSFAAVELAKKIFGNLHGKTVLLVGAGEMSELAAKHLISSGVSRIIVANRTYSRAVKLADDFHGTPISLDLLEEELHKVDIVISSTDAPGYIIKKEVIAQALHRRENRLMFLIDIAVPRDIDPDVGMIDNVYLYNIDNLREIVGKNLNGRMKEKKKAEAIIDEEVLKFSGWLRTLEVVPTIVSLQEKVKKIVEGELKKSSSWMRNLSKEEKENISILISSVTNKILHYPMTGLKDESRNNGVAPYVAVVRKIFRLDDE
jgi:glutamyl-tRNA reductase